MCSLTRFHSQEFAGFQPGISAVNTAEHAITPVPFQCLLNSFEGMG